MHKRPKNVQQNSTQNNEIYGSQWTNLKRLLESDLIVLELSFLSSNPPHLFSGSPSQTLSKFPFPHLSLSHVSVPPKSANLASFSYKPLPTPLLLIQEDVIPSTTPMVSHPFCHMSMQLGSSRKRSPHFKRKFLTLTRVAWNTLRCKL